MSIEEIISISGVPTFIKNLIIQIPVNATVDIPMPKQMPQQIGLIYGLTSYTDTFSPANNPLITSADATVLYLILKDGNTEFIEPLRLDDLQNTVVGVPLSRSERYWRCNIPGNFDLSASLVKNPTGIVSAPVPAAPTEILIGVKFISTDSVKYLVDNKYLSESVLTFVKGKR